jgi:hypothetical protein
LTVNGRRPYTLSNKNKQATYKPTKKFIGVETGFIQAAQMLDVAAQHAIASRNVEAMVDVADSWVNMSLAMNTVIEKPEEMEDDDEDESGSRHDRGAPVGFGVTAKDIKEYHDNNK